jgi:YfiH family protein
MFQREDVGGKLIGFSLLHKHVFFFFGTRLLTREDLMRSFPEYECAFLKQVHGREVVEAKPPQTPEADAHWTRMATRALVVQTADCVPILLASKNQVCAIHAGWRGVAQNIVAATAPSFADDPVLFAAIGPHILKNSFEAGDDVAHQLTGAPPSTTGKQYVDLTALVRAQLQQTFGAKIKIFECAQDTKTSADFHSFRRDGAKAGRQYSFVVLNS